MLFLSEEDVMSLGLTMKDVIDILEDEFIAINAGDFEIVQSEAEFKQMLSEGRSDPSPDTQPGAM